MAAEEGGDLSAEAPSLSQFDELWATLGFDKVIHQRWSGVMNKFAAWPSSSRAAFVTHCLDLPRIWATAGIRSDRVRISRRNRLHESDHRMRPIRSGNHRARGNRDWTNRLRSILFRILG